MGFSMDLVNSLISFFGAICDLTSDVINSLDFIGVNATSTLLDTVNICVSSSESCGSIKVHRHETWGYIGLGIIFLPGLVLLPPFLVGAIRNKNWTYFFIFLFLIPFYPITLILVQLLYVVSNCCLVDKNVKVVANIAIAMEAFFEGFCQLVLQGYTVLYGYPVTKTQMVSVIFSFLALARTATIYDILMKKVELNFVQSLCHCIDTLPCYASAIVFRVTALSLTIAYLRLWSIIPISLLFLELLIPSYIRYRNVEEKSRRFAFVYLTCLSNGGVLNANNFGELNSDEEDHNNDDDGRRFIRYSSIITFLHHTTVLCVIIVLTILVPDYFEEGRVSEVVLRPESCHFLWVFGVTILIGFQSMVFSLSNARKVADVEPKPIKTPSMGKSLRKSIRKILPGNPPPYSESAR